jgi:hypothetical protein
VRKPFLIVVIMMCLLAALAACSADDSDGDTVQATPDAGAQPGVTEEATPEVTAEAVVTEEVAERTIPNVSRDRNYVFNVIDVFDDFSVDDLSPAGDGQKWMLARLSLTNNDAPAFEVAREAVFALDEEGNRYTPAAPDEEAAQPSIFNQEIATQETLVGFALFQIPQGSTLESISWCLSAECNEPLTARVVITAG